MSLAGAAFFMLALMAVLFGVAAFAEVRADAAWRRRRLRHVAYTLALGVYCSSWTIYGAVGSAVRDGWNYLPIYLAPILLLIGAPRFLAALSRAVAEEQATTVSDFLAARFGHDVVVARLVTVIALAGTVPYMALQLRSVGTALAIITERPLVAPAMAVAAVVLAAFAILFGARRYEVAGRSEGMVYAIGLDSLFKIVALVLVGGVAVAMLLHAPAGRVTAGVALLAERFQPQHLGLETVVIAGISALAVLALPRQFYMGLVEAREPADLPRARLGLAAYLAVMALLILPIALAGVTLLDPHLPADFYVLELPQAGHFHLVAAAALIGGTSAGAAMLITDATALATMVSNDLVFPTVMRGGSGKGGLEAGALGRRMLAVRRASIVGIVAFALVWAEMVSPRQSLASIGLVAFAAMAQFSPHLIMATIRRGQDALAARASLSVGLALWLYTLALPPVLPEGWMHALAGGPLDPLRLLGIGHGSPLVHGVMWSLGANLAVFVAVAARKVPAAPLSLPRFKRWQRQVLDVQDLLDLTASFIGRERAEREFLGARAGAPVDRRTAQRARELIAAVVGTSSARALVASALAGGTMSLAEVTRLLDERGQSLSFSRALLAATFENIDAGISVVDAEQNLVAWNSRYEQLFGFPPDMLYVGAPVADLIRFNAERGDFGPAHDIEAYVRRRLEHFRRGGEHSFERVRADGRVIKTVGGPMPGGGYVTSYTDITEEARVRAELEATLMELESRVAQRTEQLSAANRQLARATRDKTRFLAAASHDLLQPLHAARLFSAALEREVEGNARHLVGRVESAILAAEDLLRALLDISKLDAGGVVPRPEILGLGAFISDLIEGLRPMAEAKGLALRVGRLIGQVDTDPGLLRSLLQNFIVNAVRYTQKGGVLVGVRRRFESGQAGLRIDVIDTGVGIEPHDIEAVFGEFTRLGTVEAEGLGLGLALSERIARLLGARIEVASNPGRGSRFSLWMPAMAATTTGPMQGAPAPPRRTEIAPLTVLVLDNDPRTVEATIALLNAMGHRAVGAGTGAAALRAVGGVDAVLVDYRLDTTDAGGESGLDVVAAMRVGRPALPAMLITAENNPAIIARAEAMDVDMVAKPAAPVEIEGFLARVALGLAGGLAGASVDQV